MAFDEASQDVQDLLDAGAWWRLSQLGAGVWSLGEAFQHLQDTLNALNSYSYQAVRAVVDRYQAALNAAATLRRRSVNPLTRAEHVGYPGLAFDYVYHVTQRFVDPSTGRTFSRMFEVGSDQPLTRDDVYAAAQLAVGGFLDDQEYITLKHGGDEWFQQGQARIVAALYRI